jgi:hypothetical protein
MAVRLGGSMTTYDDTTDHLLAELERIDLLLTGYTARWQSAIAESANEYRGLYVSDSEVTELLGQSRADRPSNTATILDNAAELATEIDKRVMATLESGVELRLSALSDRFTLSRRERDALLLAVAPEIDEKYEAIYGYLRDDATAKRPTVGLIYRVLAAHEADRLGAMALFAPSSPLVSHEFIRLRPLQDELPTLSKVVTVDRRLVHYLLNVDELDSLLAPLVSVKGPELATSVEDDIREYYDANTRARLTTLMSASNPDGVVVYHFHGPPGAGPRKAVAMMCCALGAPRLHIRVGDIPERDERQVFHRLMREATLRGAVIHLEVDALPDDRSLETVVSQLDRFENHVFITGTMPWTPQQALKTHALESLAFPKPSFSQRRQIWERHTDVLPPTVEPTELASTFSLTQGQIEAAIAVAKALGEGTDIERAALYRACSAQSTAALEDLARKLDPHYTWDDIVLSPNHRNHLEEVAAYVTHRGTVFSDWGFGERYSLGNGVTLLFTGPSGTGKTMAAEVIASHAGLELYKIDLSSVVSKYIGETEKNLGGIFDEAQESNAILFFDEADALFGKRSEVSDAKDRYANVEVNYLLQRIEEHDGTVILTTNFDQNIDDAFLRRITASIEFPRPEESVRREIWAGIFPDATPVSDLDLNFLAGFSLTGGNIKNVAQTAAFLAADDDGVVTMTHIVRALKREFQKTGMLIKPGDFGEYQED